ncbi:MAG: SLC13 family permease [Pseudomonadota bacterium]
MIDLLTQTQQAYAAIVILMLLFAAFMSERYPPAVSAVAAVAVMLALGIIDADVTLSALSNSAPATIAAMFVLSAALVRTGVLATFTSFFTRLARRVPTAVRPAILLSSMGASAIANNTPVVLVMIPLVSTIARSLRTSTSKLLIPLSYAAIVGGTCTLIGTSTNILVDGVAREAGQRAFSLFEITPVGLTLCMAAGFYLWLVAPRLLPQRTTVSTSLPDRAPQRFFVEVLVPHDSELIGQKALDVSLFKAGDRRLVDVIRNQTSLRRAMQKVVLQSGDRVVMKSSVAEIMTMRNNQDVQLERQAGQPEADQSEDDLIEQVDARQAMLVEALIGPKSKFLGRTLRQIRMARRYGVYPLALHRQGENASLKLDDTPLLVGDTLLLEGAPEDLNRLNEEADLLNLTEPSSKAFRRSKAWISFACIGFVVFAAAIDLMPIFSLALIGMVLVLITGCIDMDEAIEAIDWQIIILIYAMLAVGTALQDTGALALLVQALLPLLSDLPPTAVLAVIFIMCSVITETVTNNAVAVVMTPIAMSVADQLGYDARPFIVTVMFAASASFATPIGYQTNTLVYSAGGYRFTDFLKVGLPMNFIAGAVVVIMSPMIWPL